MSKLSFRGLAVLTAAALASFSPAQEPASSMALRESPAWSLKDGVVTLTGAPTRENFLSTRQALADSVTSLEYRSAKGAHAAVYVQGRYAVALDGTGDWQPVSFRFRAPRMDPGFRKIANALLLDVRVGDQVRRNVVFAGPSEGARWDAEDFRGPLVFYVTEGGLELRKVSYQPADFSPLTVPADSGGATNEQQLVDSVATGRELFHSVGCEACHQVEANSAAVSSGPNLFGLFQPDPRMREVAEGADGRRFQVKAGREYLHRSVRSPAAQVAIAERGDTRGQPYLPVMPAFAPETLSDAQIDAIGDYLATLNEPAQQGPVVKLTDQKPAPPYDPMTDSLQWLVDDRVRLQRGPMPGTSGRAIHVGNPGGVNYSFDPRLLAVVKIWQGGFLDMSGELVNRGNRGLAPGHDSREIAFGEREYLLAPLNAAGGAIDFSFKEGKFGDFATFKAALESKEDQLARIAAVDAQFLGYSRDSRDKLAAPVFRYRVGKNVIETSTTLADSGALTVTVRGNFATPQSFALNTGLARDASVTAGKLEADRWTLPAGKVDAKLQATIAVAADAWRPPHSNYSYLKSPLRRTPAQAQLPAGYSIEDYFAPKDNYGRDQLFEALGLAVAKDGTIIVGTRTAGIWRIVNGEWRPFAEGLFDSLGVVVEDDKGLVVVAGQKAELTRISDTDGDGLADKYETLFDAHSYHGNYHSYMHGPVRARDGSYYLALNLVHDPAHAYMAGGNTMGTWGGFNGWAVHVLPTGKFELFANGMRSPASLGVGPDGRLWYTDNQGDFVATSKLFELRKDVFYGHPAGLVDLPGMTPASPEIRYEKWVDRRARPAILFPHNRVANSPGNPAWVTQPKFGPFQGQMLVGDQTQSNLLRVEVEKVGDQEQGSVMPFFAGLESGVMRPVFMPDGSLLLGQTGRGWQAKGGRIAALQHVRWDGRTVAPAIRAVHATRDGFRVEFTQPLAGGASENILKSALVLESWTYRDAPDYGSPELDLHGEEVQSITVSRDRKSLLLRLASTEVPSVHPHQTARVYHLKLSSQTLFDAGAPPQLEAYYTLWAFPAR
ncbi:MAG TPA: c-type cytochrome [Steroidobacteraceae bacterium]|nr:c-type cytochrome [Steroidobacteraceae bacterium]